MTSGRLAKLWQLRSQRRRDAHLISRSGLFDPAYYASQVGGISPDHSLLHYLDGGWRSHDPNPFFSTSWYLENYAHAMKAGTPPLLHYLRTGWKLAFRPGPDFDPAWYRERYADVAGAGSEPLGHFLRWGRAEGRLPSLGWRPKGRTCPLSPFEAWLAVNHYSEADRAELIDRLAERSVRLPAISVIMPVYNPDPRFLAEAIASVRDQIYDQWELCVTDDGSSDADVIAVLKDAAAQDNRIRLTILPSNGGISAATNAGLAIASGEVIVFLDHDDRLTPDALGEMALHFADHSDIDLFYSDDDKIDAEGVRFAPQFKPGWSPTLLLSWMYLGHLVGMRRSLIDRVGEFRSAFDGAQDYDYALRASEAAVRIGHIPRLLYHWRAADGSTATSGHAKSDSIEAGRRALQDALRRRQIDATAEVASWARPTGSGFYSLLFDAPTQTTVTAVLLDNGSDADLAEALAILSRDADAIIDIRIVTAQSDLPVRIEANISILRLDPALPLSKRYGLAAEGVTSDFILFAAATHRPKNDHWLANMVGLANASSAGIVGPRIVAANGTLLSAGQVHLKEGRDVEPAFAGLATHEPGYLAQALTSRECASASAAFLLTRQDVFSTVSGFSEALESFEEIGADFCSRAAAVSERTIVCAEADVVFEGLQEGRIRKLGKIIGIADPTYNGNLSDEQPFAIAARRPATRNNPIRLAAVTHNLNREGAPTTLLELLVGLRQTSMIDPLVLAPRDGPLRKQYEEAGIRVEIVKQAMAFADDAASQLAACAGFGMLLSALKVDVVLANTLQTYWAIKGATLAGIPSIWAQHESEPWHSYFDYLPKDMRPLAYEAFADAYRVVTVAEATRSAWAAIETKRNFTVIPHGIPQQVLEDERSRWTRSEARGLLGIQPAEVVACCIGTLCERKGQSDLVAAWSQMSSSSRDKLRILVAGLSDGSRYSAEVEDAARLHSRVTIAGPVDDASLYLRAADIYVCTSRIESAPRVLLEAMNFDLPIVTTPVFGITEQVIECVNALFYEPGDTRLLAEHLENLVTNDALRRQLGDESGAVLRALPTFGDMVADYLRTIKEAANLDVAAFTAA